MKGDTFIYSRLTPNVFYSAAKSSTRGSRKAWEGMKMKETLMCSQPSQQWLLNALGNFQLNSLEIFQFHYSKWLILKTSHMSLLKKMNCDHITSISFPALEVNWSTDWLIWFLFLTPGWETKNNKLQRFTNFYKWCKGNKKRPICSQLLDGRTPLNYSAPTWTKLWLDPW